MGDKRTTTRRVAGYVWCDHLGEIHADALDPYNYGGEEKCDPHDHRSVFVRARMDEGFGDE